MKYGGNFIVLLFYFIGRLKVGIVRGMRNKEALALFIYKP